MPQQKVSSPHVEAHSRISAPAPYPFEKQPLPQPPPPLTSSPPLKQWFRALLNPSQLADSTIRTTTLLVVPILAFAIFFLQIGLDQVAVGAANWTRPIGLAVAGGLLGLVLALLISGVGWLGTRPFNSQQSLIWVVRSFSGAYLSALIYGGMGLMANLLFGWHTAVAFGVTGVLWSLGPILTTLRRMTANRLGASLILTTLCGLIVLFAWAVVGGIL